MVAAHTGVIRGNGVTVRLELDESGLPYERRDHPVWSVWDSREREERLLCNGRCRRLVGAPVDPLVSLLPPSVRLYVEIEDVGKIVRLDEAPDIPYRPFPRALSRWPCPACRDGFRSDNGTRSRGTEPLRTSSGLLLITTLFRLSYQFSRASPLISL